MSLDELMNRSTELSFAIQLLQLYGTRLYLSAANPDGADHFVDGWVAISTATANPKAARLLLMLLTAWVLTRQLETTL